MPSFQLPWGDVIEVKGLQRATTTRIQVRELACPYNEEINDRDD